LLCNPPEVSVARIDGLLKLLIDNRGDELILEVGVTPRLRRGGSRLKLFLPEVNAEMHRMLVGDLLDDPGRERLKAGESIEFTYGTEDLGEFAVQVWGSDGERARFAHSRRAGVPAAPPPPPAPRAAAPPAPAPAGRAAPPQPTVLEPEPPHVADV
jgi:hypothetical protein